MPNTIIGLYKYMRCNSKGKRLIDAFKAFEEIVTDQLADRPTN